MTDIQNDLAAYGRFVGRRLVFALLALGGLTLAAFAIYAIAII